MADSTFSNSGVHRIVLSQGIELAYTDEGTGTPLVFLHGLGSYRQAWLKNTSDLARNFRCLAPDLPNYGQSSQGQYPFSMQFFCKVVWEFIDRLGLRRPVLVGHSMGGQIAMLMALQRPADVGGLVLVAPAGFETFSDTEKRWINNVYSPYLLRAMPVDQIIRNFDINFFKFPSDAWFMVEDRLRLRDQALAYELYCDMIPRCVEGMLNEPVYQRLWEIEHPVLIVFGENDQLIPNTLLHQGETPASVAEKGHRRLVNSHLLIFPRCGHFVQWEAAPFFNDAVRHFIQRENL